MRVNFLLIILWVLCGCATPATSFLGVEYQQPTTAAFLDPNSIQANTLQNRDKIPAAVNPADTPRAVIRPDFSRPEVGQGEPWSIVLARAKITDDKRGLFDGAPNIALLLRVNIGDNSTIDGKWILAYAQGETEVPSWLNFQDLLVWSGITNKTIVIDFQLVKLNKADKERMAGYLGIAEQVAGAIPTYGPIASAIVKTGEAINASRDDYTILLNFRAGFHPGEDLRYAAYALLPQEIAASRGDSLWYDLRGKDLKSGDKALASNWCTFRIIKGSSRTFEYGRAESLEKIRKYADSWVESMDPTVPATELKKAVAGLVSSAEATRIIGATDFRNKTSLAKTMREVKQRQATPEFAMSQEDYNRFFQVMGSYFPPELLPANNSVDEWIQAVGKLDNYHYDKDQERWAANK